MEEEVARERVRRGRRGGDSWKRKRRRSGLADGRRVKKGGSARESERSIRTLATFFVVGTGNRERETETRPAYVRVRARRRGG